MIPTLKDRKSALFLGRALIDFWGGKGNLEITFYFDQKIVIQTKI